MGCSRSWLSLVAAIACGVVALTWPARGWAFCRSVTESPPNGYNPAQQGCFTGEPGHPVYELFWRNQCVSYSLQDPATKLMSQSDVSRVAAQAFSSWSAAACEAGAPSISATPYPTVTCNQVPSQGHNNVIMFRDDGWPHDDGANAIGFTTLTVDLDTGEVLGADIEINSAAYTIVPDAPAPEGAYDLGTILTHEAGHFLGLAHSQDTTAVMYAFYKPGSTTLAQDDVSAICSAYTAAGTRVTSGGVIASDMCNAAPFLGFLSDCGSIDSGVETQAASIGSGGVADAGTDGSTDAAAGATRDATTAGDAGDVCPDPFCAMGRAPGSSGSSGRTGSVALFALVALGARARRARRAVRARAVSLSLAVLLTGAAGAREARASVSVAVLFDDLLREASVAAVVTPTEQRALWEGSRIVTYSHLRVDRLIAGQLAGEVWVRTLGGAVGHIGQIVEGDATFAVGRPSLVFLRAHVDPATGSPAGTFVVVERAQGQFPITTEPGQSPRLAQASDPGGLVAPATARARGLRCARDVLPNRTVEDAAREIAAAWARRR